MLFSVIEKKKEVSLGCVNMLHSDVFANHEQHF